MSRSAQLPSGWRRALGGFALVTLSWVPAHAQKPPAAPKPAAAPQKSGPSPTLLPGAGSHEPINIDAGKLDYYDKEQKLVYSGSVVAVQGDSTLKASQLVIFLTKSDPNAPAPAAGGENAAAATAGGAAAGAPGAGSSVRHMEAKGPVTLISKDQIGTGDNGTYDKDENRVTLTGNVTLSQGPNVTRGDRLVYDLTSGQAQVFSGKTNGRVSSIFTPGSGTPDAAAPAAGPAGHAAAAKKPAPKKKATTASQP
ncbi:LptA/OstA family protein [Lichenifustis flavocetrariae]|uniref:Organic solvent tolerance protein OstA n=1 Tax=Lichenifustis flavocetrariae TaxID=2949735 RepID=A0AA42CI27_9HYPH|nr:LptA/OstA family protein [Lichenifustis flavocetrariae]MCW6507909.1 organic solvent tolerance protein OstA [Lichenifustis flavocetrariae]